MIKKSYRLNEFQVKKVLGYKKPFFSYGCVLNYYKNNLDHNRFAIIISGKSVSGSVERNFFRRKFYDLVKNNILTEAKKGHDLVFVIKKETKLDKKDFESINSFEKDIKFLLKKITF